MKLYNQPEVPDFKVRMAYNSDGRQEYIGKAAPHKLETDAAWQIIKITYDSDGRQTEINFASGNDKLDKKWSARAGYTYA